jgi:hypothetical protein
MALVPGESCSFWKYCIGRELIFWNGVNSLSSQSPGIECPTQSDITMDSLGFLIYIYCLITSPRLPET